MTGRTVYLSLGGLRQAAAVLRRTTGLRVVIHEPPYTSPRCGKHAGVVHRLGAALRGGLPAGRAVVEGVGIELPGDDPGPRPYVVPDLAVCPEGFLRADDAFLHPQDVELAVEVVARRARPWQTAEAVDRYARAAVRALLVVDPRPGHASWALHAEPAGGHYAAVRVGTWGAAEGVVPLPEPLGGCEVSLGRMPLYGT